jgi:hypothetical protein
VEQILIDAGLNENQIRMSFELKLQLTGTTKTVLLWNVISEKSEEFVELFYSGLLSAIGCQADYDDTSKQ